jgi:ferrous-iron efflux pump FieF
MYSGFMIFHEAYEVFVNPRPIANTSIGVIVMIISCIALYKLLYFQKYVAIRTESIIVKGDSLHYLSDFFMNICVIISLILSERFVYVDVVCGLTVGCYVFYSAFLIMKNAINDLMDKALPQKTQSEIIKAIESVDGVKKIKILRTRFAGMKKYVEARVAIEADISFLEANKIAENSENEVKKLFEKVDVIIKTETA